MLRRGVAAWNKWRLENSGIRPDFCGAELRELQMGFLYDNQRLQRANLIDADFSFSDLRKANFAGAYLDRASFQSCNLTGASLRKARLSEALLADAVLDRANLHRAWLANADLRNASLRRACFEIDMAEGAKLHGALLERTQLAGWDGYYVSISRLALLGAEGLDQLHPGSEQFIQRYISDILQRHEIRGTPAEWALSVAGGIKAGLIRQRTLFVPNKQVIEVVGSLSRRLIEEVRKCPSSLHAIGWRDFEELVAEILRANGWSVELTQPSKDGGYDILGVKTDALGIPNAWIFECKKYAQGNPVGIEIVRSLYTVKQEMRVNGAMIATTSDFTRGAREFKLSRYDLDLAGHRRVLEWIDAYR